MKIAFFSYAFPWPLHSGMNLRVYHLVEQLATRHEVTLVSLLPAEHPDGDPFPLEAVCTEVVRLNARSMLPTGVDRFSPWAPLLTRLGTAISSPIPSRVRQWNLPQLVAAFRTLNERGRFDVAWVDRAPFAEVARRAGFSRIIVDLADLDSVTLHRELREGPLRPTTWLRYLELAKLRWYERGLPRRFWRIAVCKEADRDALGGSCRNVFVVPNGVAPHAPCAAEAAGDADLLYTGAMEYAPNVDAVRYFVAEILPRIRMQAPDARLHVVGRNPPPSVMALHDGAHVLVHGAVHDLRPHLERATVVVAPIRLGSGTRLKVLEALAHEKALVATSVAIEGLALRDGVDLEVRDTPEEFATACVHLLGDPIRRAALAHAGRQRVLGRYTWEAVGREAERVVDGEGASSHDSPSASTPGLGTSPVHATER